MKKSAPLLIILTPGFPENENDTACLPFVQSFIRALNRQFSFMEIVIFSFQYPFRPNPYLWNGNTVVPFNGRNRGKLLRRLLWLRVWRRLKNLIASRNVAGIFSLWCGECALLGHRFSQKTGVPHFCWILGQDARAGNKYVDKIKPGPNELVAVSDFVADEFFKNYLVRPQFVIPIGIEKEAFGKATYERMIDVLGAGSLIPLKRYDIFIKCISELRKTMPHIYSVLAGKGELKLDLHEKIKQYQPETNIFLNGEVAHKNLLALMQQSKVFLHPSSYEGFSMVCLEALYAGCHVVSFCQPMKEDIDHWHVVGSKEEMIKMTLEILTTESHFNPVTPYSIQGTARSIMALFGYQ